MKKLFYFAMALGLVACQAEKVDVNNGADGEFDPNYLYISLVNNAGGTRAGNDYQSDYEDGYQGGKVDESNVTAIRLYFFGADNKAFPVKDGNSFLSMDISNKGAEKPNVEHIIEATVVIEKKSASDIPASVVAILNPTGDIEATNYDLSDLEKLILNVPLTTTSGFVMSNSVYSDELTPAKKVFATPIKEENLAATPAAAMAKPVTIYVERTVAKVSLDFDEDLADITLGEGDNARTLYGILDSKTKEAPKYKEENGTEHTIYLDVLGWNVTNTVAESYLIKSINVQNWPNSYTSATDNLFQTAMQPWNYKEFFRSFWAENPETVTYQYGDFNGPSNESNVNPAKGVALGKTVYLHENAAVNGGAVTSKATQVIIAGQLVNETGAPVEIAEYAGIKYYGSVSTPEQDGAALLALKKAYANFEGLYKITNDDVIEGDGTYKKVVKIQPTDIQIVTAADMNNNVVDPNTAGRYYVYAQLTEAAEKFTWTKNPDAKTQDPDGKDLLKIEDVNTKLLGFGHSKVWTSGYTYYYFDIRHLADPNITEVPDDSPEGTTVESLKAAVPGYYGVVRNHAYKSTISSIVGLGTPVYDPSETIYTEKPTEEDVILAAEIKILSWRIVANDYELNW